MYLGFNDVISIIYVKKSIFQLHVMFMSVIVHITVNCAPTCFYSINVLFLLLLQGRVGSPGEQGNAGRRGRPVIAFYK